MLNRVHNNSRVLDRISHGGNNDYKEKQIQFSDTFRKVVNRSQHSLQKLQTPSFVKGCLNSDISNDYMTTTEHTTHRPQKKSKKAASQSKSVRQMKTEITSHSDPRDLRMKALNEQMFNIKYDLMEFNDLLQE